MIQPVKHLCLLLIISSFSSYVYGEIILDGSMGTAGSLSGSHFQITQDLGQQVGGNLFHSFDQFNLSSVESATFSGSSNIQNIISRVTGGQASTLNGTIQSTIPGASLYFLNPAGVIFGENATLDVQGSFHASTADYLTFKNGSRFDTGIAMTNPVLSIAAPEAFGFLDDAPASISISGGNNKLLAVPEGATLSLIGGDISIHDRSLYAPSGQVILASVGSTGEVIVSTSGIETSSFTKGGHIHISHSADNPITTLGQTTQLADIDVSADTAGRVIIRGGQMVMDNAYIWADTRHGKGGDINIALAGELLINGVPETPPVEKTPQSGITAYTQGKGDAGNIIINVDSLKLTHGTRVESTSIASGNGGDILISANTVSLKGDTASAVPRLVTSTLDNGNSGDIIVNSNNSLEVSDGAYIRTFTSAKGNAGAITINTGALSLHGAQINSNATQSAKGNTGDLTITASNSIDVSSAIISNSTAGKGGSGGDLTITAANSFDLHNKAFIVNATLGEGHGGNININANNLNITDEAGIQLYTTGDGNSGHLNISSNSIKISNSSSIFSRTEGKGSGGDLTFSTNNLKITHGGFITNAVAEEATGKGGHISINAMGEIFLSGNYTEITSNTLGSGNSGGIEIKSDRLNVQNGASINAYTSSSGNSGDIVIDSNEIVLMRDNVLMFNRVLTEPTTGINVAVLDIKKNGTATGDSGDLTIKANKLIVRNGASISAKNAGQGDSGDILIEAGEILLTNVCDDCTDANIIGGGIEAGNSKGIGNSGNLTVNSGLLVVENGADINTTNNSKASTGNLIVNSDTIILSGNDFKTSTGIFSTNTSGTLGSLTVNSINLIIDSGAEISSSTVGEGDAGNINIQSQSIQVLGHGSAINSKSLFSAGNAGNINISTDSLNIKDGANVNTATFGAGLGGNINVQADNILLSGENTGISSGSYFSTGNAGNIGISTDSLKIEAGAEINALTSGFGLGGNINVQANNISLLGKKSWITTRATETSSRNTGDLTIQANFLEMRGGAIIDSRTESQGVPAFVSFTEGRPDLFVFLDLTTLPLAEYQNSFGNGGELTINVEHIDIRDNAKIDVSTSGNGSGGNLTINAQTIFIDGNHSEEFTGISSQAHEGGAGNAGNLTINTSSLEVLNHGEISASTFNTGRAGDLNITANDMVINNARIHSESALEKVNHLDTSNSAQSGNVLLTVNNTLTMENKGVISVSTNAANAGGIEIKGGGLLMLSGESQISTSVADGKGKGGNISINMPIVALDSSHIIAQAKEGEGGDISMNGFLFQSPSSRVDASSELNTDGELKLKPDTNISGNIAVLSDKTMDASTHFNDYCTARSGKKTNSFVIKGRGGFPLIPGELVPVNFMDNSFDEKDRELENPKKLERTLDSRLKLTSSSSHPCF